MEVSVVMRKLVIVSGRRCWRSVCQHPFLVGFLCFLFLLYRSFPLLFSLLVSASPILICTAILLGTLLSFGEPRYPEIEKEERVSEEISLLKTESLGDATVVVSRDGSIKSETFMDDKRDIIERAVERVISANGEARVTGEGDGVLERTPLIHDHFSLKAQGGSEKQASDNIDKVGGEDEEEEGEEEEAAEKGRDLNDGEVGVHRYSLIEEAGDEVTVENGELQRDVSDAHTERIVSSKHGVDREDEKEEEQEEKEEEEEQEEEEEDHDDDGSSASDSDRAESSSPDASMADILPMLDELHPLLEREDQQALLSRHESNVASEHSHDSENGNVDSEDDSESAEGEDGENENDDEEEEESPAARKEDAGKSAITWTEDDQKNLMDLGTSELERNQRLENLIARRRARRLMAEKNLIDFEGSDLPFNVPSIATTRNNPFDGPDDTYSSMGLPPIPGSAPSILLPRRNPFDLPYEPNEEKPDLKEESFQQEFVSPPPAQPPIQNQHRENLFFRRHESFHVGPSRHDAKWKPYFVPEHLASEGTSFRSFERQSSGMSDSKASSVPDTESVTSTVDNEEKTANESEELLNETEEMSNMDRASLLVEHGSAASDDTDHQEIDELEGEQRITHHEEVEIILGDTEADTESQHDIGPSLSADGIRSFASAPSDVNEFEVKEERVEQEGEEEAEEKEQQQEKEGEEEEEKEEAKSSRSGSSSIFSEVDEKIDEVKKDGGASSSQINYPNEELRPQLDDVEFTFVTDHHKEPVYDSSPKYHSFSSGSSDPATRGGSELFEEDMQNVDHGNENHARDADTIENREDDIRRIGSLESEEEIFVEQNGSPNIPEAANEEVVNVSVLPSSGVDPIGHDLVNYTHVHHEHDSIEPQPSNVSSVVTELSMDSEDPFPSEQGVVDDIIGSNHHGHVQQEENHQTEMDMEVPFNEQTINPASGNRHILSDLSDELPHEEHPFVPEERSTLLQEVSEMGEQHLNSDVQSSSDVIHDESELPDELGQSAEEISAICGENPEEVLDDGVKDLVVISTLASQSPTYSTSSNYESPTAGPSSGDQTPGGEEYRILRRQITEYYDPSLEIFGTLALDEALKQGGHEEIKDIDEGFLMELDAVGDFRIIETGNTSHSPKLVGYDDSRGAHFESESQDLSESAHKLPVLEPRSVEDITMAFRQLDEGAGVKEVNLASSINGDDKRLEGAELGSSVTEVRSVDGNAKELPENIDGESLDVEVSLLEGTICNEPNDSNGSSSNGDGSNLPTLEVRSVEDVKLAFKQLDEGAEIDEVILPSSIKDQHESESSEGTSSGLPVVEVRSREDVTMAFKQLDEGAEIDEVILPSSIKDHQESEISDRTSSSLPVVEARSRDDVTMAFKQLYEGAEIDEVILPSSIKDQQDSQSSEVTSSGLPVVEARSHDDVTMALKQLHEGAEIDEVILPSSIKDLRLSQSEVTSSGLPVVEARSRDDVTMAFKQLDEGVEIDEVILPSSIKDQQGSESLGRSSSGLPVVEARSHEDVTMALKQLHEGSEIDEVILPSSIKYQQESNSSEVTSSGLPVVEVRSHYDVKMAFKQLDEGAEIDEVILPSSIKDQQELKRSEGTSAGLPVVEARSRDDVTMAFKRLQEGAEIDEVILPSSIEDQKISKRSEGKSSGLPVVEARSLGDVTMTFQQLEEGAEVEEVILPSSIKYQQDSESSGGTSSGLPVVEARTPDDIHNIAKQVVEENYEMVPERTIESENRSVEAEVTQETKEVNSQGETTTEAVDRKTTEAVPSKSSDSSAKKKKSRKSKSGSDSSSSSSSGSSDSD